MRPMPRTSPSSACLSIKARSFSMSRPPTLARVFRQPTLQQSQRGERGLTGQRIAAERAAVAAIVPLHHFVARDHGRDRHARRDALREDHDVGVEVEVLGREQLARATHAALHLIGDQQDAVLPTQSLESA